MEIEIDKKIDSIVGQLFREDVKKDCEEQLGIDLGDLEKIILIDSELHTPECDDKTGVMLGIYSNGWVLFCPNCKKMMPTSLN